MLGTIDQPACRGCWSSLQGLTLLEEATAKYCYAEVVWFASLRVAHARSWAVTCTLECSAVCGLAPEEKCSAVGTSSLHPVGMQGTPWVVLSPHWPLSTSRGRAISAG